MTSFNRSIVSLGAAMFVGTMLAQAVPAQASDRTILRCSAEGTSDISMSAKHETRDARRKFSVEMEAAPNGDFERGQKLAFFVADVKVATGKLERVTGGDLVADINFDTQAGPNDPDEDPFPANFPKVNKGSKVRIMDGAKLVLGCALR